MRLAKAESKERVPPPTIFIWELLDVHFELPVKLNVELLKVLVFLPFHVDIPSIASPPPRKLMLLLVAIVHMELPSRVNDVAPTSRVAEEEVALMVPVILMLLV